MTRCGDGERRRAHRLMRSYPRGWRERYGDEFAELLIAEFREQPHSLRRSADVVGAGVLARLRLAGLAGCRLDPQEQVRASLAVLAVTISVFGAVGGGMWSQLTIGWQWAAPDGAAVGVAMVVMSATALALVVLAVLAAVPLVWSGLRSMLHRRTPGLLLPGLMIAAGAGALIIGSHHFSGGWPGTGGHPWSHRSLVPGGVASFCWAATLAVTSYWAHPDALASFPAAELVWMATSPLAILCGVVGLVKVVRRVELSRAALRYEAMLGRLATSAMAVFLCGAECWVIAGARGPRGLFRVGVIDVIDLVVMTASLMVAVCVVGRSGGAALA